VECCDCSLTWQSKWETAALSGCRGDAARYTRGGKLRGRDCETNPISRRPAWKSHPNKAKNEANWGREVHGPGFRVFSLGQRAQEESASTRVYGLGTTGPLVGDSILRNGAELFSGVDCVDRAEWQWVAMCVIGKNGLASCGVAWGFSRGVEGGC